MPFVTATQIERALEQLSSHHPLLLFTVPAMCKAGVEPLATQKDADAATANDKHAHYSGREETQFLKDYTAVKGGPAGKPFYSPSTPTGKGGAWVVPSYATSSLQAQRKERLGRVFLQSGDFFYPFGDDWTDFASKLRAPTSTVVKSDGTTLELVPLFALASWFFRDRNVADVASLLQLAKTEMGIPSELVGTVYDDSIPADAAATALGANELVHEDLAAIVHAVPPPPPLTGGFGDLIIMLETALKKRLVLGEDIVGQIVRAWAARDVVILVGAGGTGKTTLAKGIVRALVGVIPPESEVEVPVDQDFGISDLLGYENLAGKFVDRPLTARILRSQNPLHPHVLLLEELNLVAVESYLGPILHAIESGSPVPLTGGESVELPQDTLVLATCNSPRDEPETRIPMSGPTKRRTTAVQMPNLLFNEWSVKAEAGLREVIDRILGNERADIEERVDAGRGSWLDRPRLERLKAVSSLADLDSSAGDALLDIVGALLGTAEGQRWMTFGPLRDVVTQLVWAETADQPRVLGQLVIGKLLQQVQSADVAKLLAEKSVGLPNAAEIAAAAEDLVGPGDTVRPLL